MTLSTENEVDDECFIHLVFKCYSDLPYGGGRRNGSIAFRTNLTYDLRRALAGHVVVGAEIRAICTKIAF